jgi:hypothetical protein
MLSLYGELPWILLFFFTMLLVELQLRYCLPCLRATAKVVQSGLVVIVLRLWLDTGFVNGEQWAQTLRNMVNGSVTQ